MQLKGRMSGQIVGFILRWDWDDWIWQCGLASSIWPNRKKGERMVRGLKESQETREV
jgi:hypothetical protein